MKEYYVYIMSNKSHTLYTGTTNDLEYRVYQHKHKLIDGFTKRYNITQLVFFESTDDVSVAIEREKRIKNMLRARKIELITAMNPQWKDLSESWFDNNPGE
jgi:putative endonuclease